MPAIPAAQFEKDSFGWRMHQWQMRIGEWIERLFDRDDRPQQNWQLSEEWLRFGFYLIVGVFILWGLWQLYRLLRPYGFSLLQPQRGTTLEGTPRSSQPDLTASQWLGRSQALAHQGNYREACRSLYLSMVERLHESEIIPRDRSRTDGEYRQLIQILPNVDPYETLIQTHERLCFSDAEVSASLFQQCHQAYQQLEP